MPRVFSLALSAETASASTFTTIGHRTTGTFATDAASGVGAVVVMLRAIDSGGFELGVQQRSPRRGVSRSAASLAMAIEQPRIGAGVVGQIGSGRRRSCQAGPWLKQGAACSSDRRPRPLTGKASRRGSEPGLALLTWTKRCCSCDRSCNLSTGKRRLRVGLLTRHGKSMRRRPKLRRYVHTGCQPKAERG